MYNQIKQLDERVEDDVTKIYEGKCEEAKKQRQMYINLSKKYTEDPKNYDHYIDVRLFFNLLFIESRVG